MDMDMDIMRMTVSTHSTLISKRLEFRLELEFAEWECLQG